MRLARRNPEACGLTRRALNQAARELLLLQSREHLEAGALPRAFATHLSRFGRLLSMADAGTLDDVLASTTPVLWLNATGLAQSALAKVRDPALRSRALALAERLPGRDAQRFVEDALLDPASRPAAFAYVRANFDALVAALEAIDLCLSARSASGRRPAR